MLFSNNLLQEAGGRRPEASGLQPLLINDPSRCINNHTVLIESSFPTSTVGLMDSALASHLGNPGSIPDWGNVEISSKFQMILFISVE